MKNRVFLIDNLPEDILVLLNDTLVIADDLRCRNEAYRATAVAENLARALGVPVERVAVPIALTNQGALMVCGVTRLWTYEDVVRWVRDNILLANLNFLPGRTVPEQNFPGIG